MSSLSSTPTPSDVVAADAAVELHAADGRQVVALGVEEQVLEQVLGGFLGRRLARTHHAVDLDQRFEARRRRIDVQRVRDERTAIEIVHVQSVRMCSTPASISCSISSSVSSALAAASSSPVSVSTMSCARILPIEVLVRHDELVDRPTCSCRGRAWR